MEEKSLRITGADTSFLNKITNTLTKLLIPTKIGINGMLINRKRNILIKAFENYIHTQDFNEEELEKKYDTAYTVYLEALDKYVMDSIYKKVKNKTASEFEKNALARYYEVTSLKEKEYMDYKYRKQKYLLELDEQSVKLTAKEKVIEKYHEFYIAKMDGLYKGILKNYSIQLADSTNVYDSTKEWIYSKIFITLEEYIEKVLSLKIEYDQAGELQPILNDYEKYQTYTVGKLDAKDYIEKNMVLLGISRKLFTHSIPLIVAEQCYEKLLNDARTLLQDTKIATKREKVYFMLIHLMEDYHVRLLATKVYWENSYQREQYKYFTDKYQKIDELKEIDFVEYVKRKEVLFIKKDIKKIQNSQIDYTKLMRYYKRKLVDYGAMKELKNQVQSIGHYTGNIKIKEKKVSA